MSDCQVLQLDALLGHVLAAIREADRLVAESRGAEALSRLRDLRADLEGVSGEIHSLEADVVGDYEAFSSVDRNDLIAGLIERYPLHDPTQFASPTADLAAGERFVLIERNRDGSTHWFSTHATLAAAASYHDRQEYVDDWQIITAVDLDQGTVYDAAVVTTWSEAAQQ